MSTEREPRKYSRFQIKFENSKQREAYIELLDNAGKFRKDNKTKIGGQQLFEKRPQT